MSHKTQDYEHLLNLDNVIGVEFDGHKVLVLVTEKVPEDELDHDQIVANNTDDETDVEEIGTVSFEFVHQMQYRPIYGGISEGPSGVQTAGTGGPGPARVVDPDNGHWDSNVEEGDMVRISNNHVYALTSFEAGDYGREIAQPASLDGGDGSVSKLAGYVPLEDGISVDTAARFATEYDSSHYCNLPIGTGKEVRRDYSDLKGETLTKSGRTTGVTSSEVIATDATIQVNMGGGDTVIFRHQIVTGDMSDGGDSGSAVFDGDGRLTGLLFAGSDSATIHNRIANVEKELGVDFSSEEEEEVEEHDCWENVAKDIIDMLETFTGKRE